MAQQIRQTRMFAAEDYTVVYESYVNANFQAYDFDTIRESMVDYIRNNYPESYNDWVESAEFVALLDVIAQFGHNLAYRVDLNSRNNFLSTAERQEAVLKLSEFLGYQPRRNIAAFGQLKVVSIKTNETILASDGSTLAGQEIRFENTASIDNLDNFITVMNAVLAPSNQFGSPRQQTTINGVLNQFYNLNNKDNQITFGFQGVAQGSTVSFSAVGVGYNTTQKTVIERSPNPQGAFSVLYKNDGKGIQSDETGFFIGFKQGALNFQDFNIEEPVSSQTLDLNIPNINNSDIWVQTVNEEGNILKEWTKVDSVYGNNAIYNTIDSGIQDIFAVKTRQDNQVSICFSDERFGNLPKGTIRVWYRQSENLTYTLRPEDIGAKKITISYIGQDNNEYSAILGIQLKSAVTNASSSETLEDIKTNAPRIYATQDRMITAQDYNNYLIRQSDDIAKIKSINRTHSGHSRFIDFNDPTGVYTKVRMYATDGTLSKEDKEKQSFVSGITEENIFKNYIKPALADDELVNLYYDRFAQTFSDLKQYGYGGAQNPTPDALGTDIFLWQNPNLNIADETSNGWIIKNANNVASEPKRVGKSTTTYLKYINVGSLIKFQLADSSGNLTNEYKWAKVVSIYNDGLGVDNSSGIPSGRTQSNIGSIGLDCYINNASKIDIVYPPLARQFTSAERQKIINHIKSKQDFAIKYDYINQNWDIIDQAPAPSTPNPAQPDFPTNFTVDVMSQMQNGTTRDNNWLIHVNYDTDSIVDKWNITTRIVRYSISSNQIEFSNLTNEFSLDEDSKKKRRDVIDVQKLSSTIITGSFYIYGYELAGGDSAYGVYNTNKAILTLVDANQNDRPDNPESFSAIVSATSQDNLRFDWTHIPSDNQTVDPSLTNLIDVFVLTRNYDNLYRAWLNNTGISARPSEPTVDELSQSFSQQITKKAMSDTIIYRPVKYKVLFGNKADSDFQAKFRIITVDGAKLTDNEIKNQVVDCINEFFAIENWDFGETFYFTELAGYIHSKLVGIVSSFVIVPEGASSVFGDLFQITPMTNELFIPDVNVDDIEITTSITQNNLRAV